MKDIEIGRCFRIPGKNNFAVEIKNQYDDNVVIPIYYNSELKKIHYEKQYLKNRLEIDEIPYYLKDKILKAILNHKKEKYGFFGRDPEMEHFLRNFNIEIAIDNEYEFLPLEDPEECYDIKTAFNKVFSFLKMNASCIPLFMYGLLSFCGCVIDDEIFWEGKEFTYYGLSDVYHGVSQKGSDYNIKYSLWVHNKEYSVAQKAAALFLNVFEWRPIGFSKYDGMHLDIATRIKAKYIKNYTKPLSDAPMIIYSSDRRLSTASKTVKRIVTEMWTNDYATYPVFISEKPTRNNMCLNVRVEPLKFDEGNNGKKRELFIPRKIQELLKRSLKGNINYVFRMFIDYIADNSERIKACISKEIFDLELKGAKEARVSNIHRAAYTLILYEVLNVFLMFLNKHKIDHKEFYSLASNCLMKLLNGLPIENDSLEYNTDSYIQSFNAEIERIKKMYLQDEHNKIIWLESDNTEGEERSVYCIVTEELNKFFKKNTKTSAPRQKACLVSAGKMLKANKRFVFEKTVKGRKRYVYKILI